MGILKRTSTMYIPVQALQFNKVPAWEDHPSWLTGLQALEEFHQWVATVVLPIAFAWIKDHHKEVYDAVDKLPEGDKHYGDVGVVIAAAFQLVKKTEYYQDGKNDYDTFQTDLKDGKVKTSELNPIWTKITDEIRKATEEIFRKEKTYLDDTF